MHNGIIGIRRNDQAGDTFCITWSARSRISQDIRCLSSLKDSEDETTVTSSDSLTSHKENDAVYIKKLVA